MGAGANLHSIMDLTLASAEVKLNWCIASNHALDSDHEVLQWEIQGNASLEDATSTATTEWDIGCWDTEGKEGKKAEKARGKRAQAQECFCRGIQGSLMLNDSSSAEEVDTAAAVLKEAMVGTLDQHVHKKRWCVCSKRWWNLEVHDLRKLLGRA